MATAGDRGQNPQSAGHPRMGAGLPSGPGGTQQSSRTEGQGGVAGTVREMSSSVAEAVGQVRDRAQDLASGVAQRAEDAWDSTRQGLRQGATAVTESAQD